MSKADLHRLVDELPETEEQAARRFLEYLRDRGQQPDLEEYDEEPLSDDEQSVVARGLSEIARGETIGLGDYERERGL